MDEYTIERYFSPVWFGREFVYVCVKNLYPPTWSNDVSQK